MHAAAAHDGLTIGYSTLPERVAAIKVPAREDVRCVVVIQTGRGDHDSATLTEQVRRLEAAGATVALLDSLGVAKSRNEAMRLTRTRYLLFGDDDVSVDFDAVDAVVARMDDQGLALALGRATDPDGVLRKDYAEEEVPLTRRNSGKAATYEMVVDVERARAADVWFDERFGAGVPQYLGDEFIFIVDLLDAGLEAHAVPEVVAVHPHESSGSRWGTDADTDARAAVLDRVFGARSPLYKAAFAVRHFERLGGFRGAC
uniref:glycosyltransferase family 2 protein n=1 Tax=uncultured Demequina sp. TaxID=693499 RepID=UPI0025FCF8FD